MNDSLKDSLKFVCEMSLAAIDIHSSLILADDPIDGQCFSMVALTTLLVQMEETNEDDKTGKRYYPVPPDMDEQESILDEITDQHVKEWTAILEEELDTIQSDCLQADIDFEFVIDTSGSIGISNLSPSQAH